MEGMSFIRVTLLFEHHRKRRSEVARLPCCAVVTLPLVQCWRNELTLRCLLLHTCLVASLMSLCQRVKVIVSFVDRMIKFQKPQNQYLFETVEDLQWKKLIYLKIVVINK